MERVQHRFTRLFTDLRDLPHHARLERLGLWSLEERRNRGDLIKVFKMIKGFTDNMADLLFSQQDTLNTRTQLEVSQTDL